MKSQIEKNEETNQLLKVVLRSDRWDPFVEDKRRSFRAISLNWDKLKTLSDEELNENKISLKTKLD